MPCGFQLVVQMLAKVCKEKQLLSDILGNYGNKLSHRHQLDRKQTTRTMPGYEGSEGSRLPLVEWPLLGHLLAGDSTWF